MPELPEVEAVCRQLSISIPESKVVGTEILLQRIIREGNPDMLVGSTFKSVERIGKFIRIRTDTRLSLFVHLRMTGQLFWEPAEYLRDRFVRCILTTDNGIITFRDVRTLGGLWICDDEKPPWKKMGVDPFSKHFTVAYLTEKLAKRKVPIKPMLLDQAFIAGIGNIYASEILFNAGINPLRLASSIDSSEIPRLHDGVIRILQSAIDAKGTTFKNFRLSDGKEGAFREFLKVYAHGGEPCAICGTVLERITQAGRSTYFCSICQPLT